MILLCGFNFCKAILFLNNGLLGPNSVEMGREEIKRIMAKV